MPEQVEGIAFETLFFQELLTINDGLGLGYKIFTGELQTNRRSILFFMVRKELNLLRLNVNYF